MAHSKLTRYPVIDKEGKFVGIITIDDLLAARSMERLRESDRTRVLRLRWPFSRREADPEAENATAAVAVLDGENGERRRGEERI
jgi:CBS domain-containing protein